MEHTPKSRSTPCGFFLTQMFRCHNTRKVFFFLKFFRNVYFHHPILEKEENNLFKVFETLNFGGIGIANLP